MGKCLFCQFKEGSIDCKKSYEDDKIFSFVDWNPWEGIHIVAYPKKHIGLYQMDTEEFKLERKNLRDSIQKIADFAGIADGYQVLTEESEDSFGQDLEHLHIHITGKKRE